jgi:hypothetical protein
MIPLCTLEAFRVGTFAVGNGQVTGEVLGPVDVGGIRYIPDLLIYSRMVPVFSISDLAK